MKGVAVCREVFIHVYSISRTRLTLLHQSYKENGLMPPIKKRAGPSKHRLQLKHEDLQQVLNFINNYAEDNAIVLPGCHPGHKRWKAADIPCDKSSDVVSLHGIDDNTCFGALEPGVVTKERSYSVGNRFQLLRNADILPPIDGLPVQAPPELDTARQTYLFEKIREFCDEEAIDITRPAPKSRAGQSRAPRI
ncbi:uncharacterized protein ACWYII_006685 [Salvelinus alpinus]